MTPNEIKDFSKFLELGNNRDFHLIRNGHAHHCRKIGNEKNNTSVVYRKPDSSITEITELEFSLRPCEFFYISNDPHRILLHRKINILYTIEKSNKTYASILSQESELRK